MVFTTQIFLFVLFPISVFAYILTDKLEQCKHLGKYFIQIRSKDFIIIISSFGFYMWTCFSDIARLLVYVGIVYLLARWIESSKEKNRNFSIAVVAVVFCLVYYKYSGIMAEMWNWVFKDHMEEKSLMAPLGLSFITFSAISYLTDIYRGNATAGSPIDCALYLTFFPKVVSGPIVLWKDFQPQIKQRKTSLNLGVDGLNRIMIGFAKKLILADSFGACLAQIGTSGIDRMTAAGTLVLYMLQIYYDFSGYSDIAIGLSRLFGFKVKENFNFPYRSKSISEFWRRWHISLGTWFSEYVYFPLGGSRAGYHKTLRNLAIIFMLTGIWHGAGWNYILWGLINGALVLVEKVIQNKKFYQKTPKYIKYCLTMLVVMLFWQLFRFQSISDVVKTLGIAFGIVRFDAIYYTWVHYFDTRILMFSIIGITGGTLLGSPKLIRLYHKKVCTNIGFVLQEIVLLILFIVSILFMVNSTYSPFIYFQY